MPGKTDIHVIWILYIFLLLSLTRSNFILCHWLLNVSYQISQRKGCTHAFWYNSECRLHVSFYFCTMEFTDGVSLENIIFFRKYNLPICISHLSDDVSSLFHDKLSANSFWNFSWKKDKILEIESAHINMAIFSWK